MMLAFFQKREREREREREQLFTQSKTRADGWINNISVQLDTLLKTFK